MTRYLSSLPLALLVLASTACVPRAVPPAPVAPPPAPVTPAPAPAPTPAADWQDWPWTPGAWRYVRDAAGPRASYGVTGQPSVAELRCERGPRAVLLSRPGSNASPFTIRTSAMTRSVATQLGAGAVPQVVARFAIDDRLLDAMAFTRGRFTVEQPGVTPLVLPPWAEVGRVIEDCRR
ncbi:hypothetical protein [Sphingomonas phyllosphaerae]|uniref:hypothetical protein n=1 Tax=Sphingomonas phyllosphaerae TaxID=257003 RepID=UPI00041E3E10|nr:hypothetical protein [Sphingomonas phyllosphaerae]